MVMTSYALPVAKGYSGSWQLNEKVSLQFKRDEGGRFVEFIQHSYCTIVTISILKAEVVACIQRSL